MTSSRDGEDQSEDDQTVFVSAVTLAAKFVVLTLNEQKPHVYGDKQALMTALQNLFKTLKEIYFQGTYSMPLNPLVNNEEQV